MVGRASPLMASLQFPCGMEGAGLEGGGSLINMTTGEHTKEKAQQIINLQGQPVQP